jgi:hypothetical protein
MFKTILRIIAYILIFIALVFFANAAWNFSTGADTVWLREYFLSEGWLANNSPMQRWTPSPGRLAWAGVFFLLIAFVMDPKTTTRTLNRVGEFIGAAAQAAGKAITSAVAGVASGFGWVLIPIAGIVAWYLLKKKE